EYVFQPVPVRMFQHSTQSFHSRRAVVLRVIELTCAVRRHLGQKTGRVVVAIYTVGLGVSRNLSELVSESQRDVTELGVIVVVEEGDHLVDRERRGVDGM